MDRVVLFSNKVWIAENTSNGNMQAKFCICDFGVNKNGVQLDRSQIENWMQSMVNQPLVGKMKKSSFSDVVDFTGHNMKKSVMKNEQGEYETVVEFDTDALGTFTSVAIEEIDGVEYLVGTVEIWNRYPRAVKLIKDRIAAGTLSTSWEISVNSARTEDGVKVIEDGVFTALALLGRTTEPAYDSSRLLEVAEDEEDDELISAIKDDLKENAMKKNEKQDLDEVILSAEDEPGEPTEDDPVETDLETPDEEPAVETEQVEDEEDDVDHDDGADGDDEESVPAEEPGASDEPDVPKKKRTELSALTVSDLGCRIAQACRAKLDCDWGYIAYWFPANDVVWYWSCNAETELDYVFFVYSVLDDDTVVVDDGIPVKLTVSVAEMQDDLAKKAEAIAEAATEIAELKASLAALEPFKAAYEKAEADRLAAEKAEKQLHLKNYALSSGLITEKDFEEAAFKAMLENVDEAGIKQEIATRFMASKAEKHTAVPHGTVTASLTSEETKPIKSNVVQAYLVR